MLVLIDIEFLLSQALFIFFIYNLNQQSEFTFSKLMLWLLQSLDGESSSGESPVPQIRSIGQFLSSRLFYSPNSIVNKKNSWYRNQTSCELPQFQHSECDMWCLNRAAVQRKG
jgi:hypothetical protein